MPKITAAVIGLLASIAVNYTGGWTDTMPASAATSSTSQFGGTEVDLGAITPGLIAAFLQQLTPRKAPVYVSHDLTQGIRILPS